MSDPELEEKWSRIRRFLENANSSLLEQPQDGIAPILEAISEFKHFLSHNELELALDAIAEAGNESSPPAQFWDSLRQAAQLMELHERALDFQFLWTQAAAQALERELRRK